jgi:hypothetical protein
MYCVLDDKLKLSVRFLVLNVGTVRGQGVSITPMRIEYVEPAMEQATNRRLYVPWSGSDEEFLRYYQEEVARYCLERYHCPQLDPFLVAPVRSKYVLTCEDLAFLRGWDVFSDRGSPQEMGWRERVREGIEYMNGEREVFVRTSFCSIKDGTFVPSFKTTEELCTAILSNRRTLGTFHFPFPHALIVFDFVEKVDIRREMRCFVFNSKVVAISQYDFMNNVWDGSDEALSGAAQSVEALWAAIRGLVPFTHCVMDVFIDESCAKLIEFNSYGPEFTSGACLFDWIIDSRILFGREGDVVVRAVEVEREKGEEQEQEQLKTDRSRCLVS